MKKQCVSCERVVFKKCKKMTACNEVYRSRFLGHGYSHNGPNVSVAPFSERRSEAHGVRRIFAPTLWFGGLVELSTSSCGYQHRQEVPPNLSLCAKPILLDRALFIIEMQPVIVPSTMRSAACEPHPPKLDAPFADHAVVDEGLRVIGTDRLYACNMSVVPLSSAANPVCTLVGLALRLSQHLG